MIGRAQGIIPSSDRAVWQRQEMRAQIKRLEEEIAERKAHLAQTKRAYRELGRGRTNGHAPETSR